jgi:hypothetical protein
MQFSYEYRPKPTWTTLRTDLHYMKVKNGDPWKGLLNVLLMFSGFADIL